MRALDVLRIHDALIRPPGPKMVICLPPKHGLFVRINSRDPFGDGVLIERAWHPFLKTDSYAECRQLLEFDETQVAEALADGGLLGSVHPSFGSALYEALAASGLISAADLRRIKGAMKL